MHFSKVKTGKFVLSLLAGVLTEVLFEGFFFIETFQDFIIAGSICPYRIE